MYNPMPTRIFRQRHGRETDRHIRVTNTEMDKLLKF